MSQRNPFYIQTWSAPKEKPSSKLSEASMSHSNPFYVQTWKAPKEKTPAKQPEAARTKQLAFCNPQFAESPQSLFVPSEFVYEYDFDNNGALFYLGTLGYQSTWQNPESMRK